MNARRIIPFAAALVFLLMLLFPPFVCRQGTPSPIGYGFIGAPPACRNSVPGSVNVTLLLTQIFVVSLISGCVWLGVRK